jgi:polyisoprenoid-binding protein YceI
MKITIGLLSFFGLSILLIFMFFPSEQFGLRDSKFIVTGTSNLQAWEMASETASGKAEMDIAEGRIVKIHSINISIPAESLSSGKPAMDKKANEALKTDKFKYINYKLSRIESIKNQNGSSLVNAIGTLTIAGITRPIKVKAKGEVRGEEISFEGNHTLLMSDFNIDPPVAMMGALKTGDQLEVKFKVVLKSQKSIL